MFLPHSDQAMGERKVRPGWDGAESDGGKPTFRLRSGRAGDRNDQSVGGESTDGEGGKSDF